jgi:hypothetical protein
VAEDIESRFVVVFDRRSMRSKKKPRLRVEKEARRRARLGIGMPPAARVIPDKREKPVKHKKRIVPTDE